MSIWLSLQEYSHQQGISISTLRRRIKNQDIEYILKNGRYLLKVPSEIEPPEKTYYQKTLEKKEEEIQQLRQDKEELLHFLNFLEKEKAELLEFIEKSSPLSP